MKKLFFYVIALLPFAASAQDTFTLKGQVGKLSAPAKAYLLYQVGANRVLDSAYIINGEFAITGKVLNPVGAILVIDRAGVGITRLDKSADNLTVYLEKGDINLNTADSVSKAQITGSPINDDNKRLTAQLALVNNKAKKIAADAKNAPLAQQQTAEFQNNIQTQLKALQAEQETTLKNFITANPKSYLSLMALSSLGGPSADPKTIEPLYNNLSPELKASEAGYAIKQSIDELKTTAIGSAAPDFTQNDANGTPIKLSSFRGKYVLLDFWASWCGPCRQENPNVVKAYNKYKTKKFTILGVSLDRPDGKADWMAAIKNDGLTWTQVSDLKYWNNEVAALYFVRSIPQNYLIDPEGRIIAKNLRGEDLDNKLAEIFGKL
ncbi:AhpC/TSA family protein [Mucilaginibacter mali]|uniref:AhpC/TSA family protein n=1 Tax=Mucilaginibacter mali TaxID=2740462 RepID=A0A7D4TJX4_9SPHI|nr:TlpA disulfide reductase family protein [Mucilaginibacter mali]QKJ28293.1 AhpC/TSA family protein [Mucilaginibacter mali]